MNINSRTTKIIVSWLCLSIGFSITSFNLFWYSKGVFALEKEMGNHYLVKEILQRDTTPSIKPKIGEEMGSLHLPRLKKVVPIFHGTSAKILIEGIGHYEKSALPGEPNNMVLSGHNDTVFHDLGKTQLHDKLFVETKKGTYFYKVKKIRIVDEDDRTVLVQKPKGMLTLTTCYPFRVIGPTKQRFVVVAELINNGTLTKNR